MNMNRGIADIHTDICIRYIDLGRGRREEGACSIISMDDGVVYVTGRSRQKAGSRLPSAILPRSTCRAVLRVETNHDFERKTFNCSSIIPESIRVPGECAYHAPAHICNTTTHTHTGTQ